MGLVGVIFFTEICVPKKVGFCEFCLSCVSCVCLVSHANADKMIKGPPQNDDSLWLSECHAMKQRRFRYRHVDIHNNLKKKMI